MSSEKDIPPYKVSGKAMNLIAEIAAAIERYRIILEGPDGVRLRKINHIRTIRGTTAIEGNTLTEEQITAILAGKRVAGPQREIDEIKDAHAAYEAIESFNPYSIDDLLKAHGLMTKGLVDRPGKFRNCNVGVMDGAGNVVHMAPPFANVPSLVKDLFAWLADSEDPVLIKSCVFHYEFEFIHPFNNGNGRTGRYWQTAILGKWRNAFYAAPIENIVWENQRGYYLAIQRSTLLGNSKPFIDFMLERILQAIKGKGDELKNVGVNVGVKLSAHERDLLELLRLDGTLTAARIAETYSISTRQAERLLTGLKKKGFLVRKGSDIGSKPAHVWMFSKPWLRSASRNSETKSTRWTAWMRVGCTWRLSNSSRLTRGRDENLSVP